jgi:signal transduction histidine kinase
MFKSAVFKLTAWYVGALVLVCIIFSIPIYSITAARLRSGAVRQTEFVRRLPDPFERTPLFDQLERLRDKQLADDRHELLLSLALINLGIVGIGAYASYLFARRTLKPIEKAHAAQARFTADASHELRTPLAVMQTEIEVALRSGKLTTKEAKEVLGSNLEEVARLRQLSDQLLGLTRADAEPLKLTKQNMAKLVTDQMTALAKRHKLQIAVQVPRNAPAAVDKVLLSQVLDIIVDNAVAYSGLTDPAIKATVTNLDDGLQIQITNQGNVIPAKDLEHIFDRFYRGSNATMTRPKGHGLGLALAKDVVTRHGGNLTATSTKKAGTVFTIHLPNGSLARS